MTSVRLRVRTGPASRTTTPRLQRGVPQGEGRAKTQRLNGQPIRDRASLPQLLGLSCACVIFDPWQRAKTTRGGEIHRPENQRRGDTEALTDRERQEDAGTGSERDEPRDGETGTRRPRFPESKKAVYRGGESEGEADRQKPSKEERSRRGGLGTRKLRHGRSQRQRQSPGQTEMGRPTTGNTKTHKDGRL